MKKLNEREYTAVGNRLLEASNYFSDIAETINDKKLKNAADDITEALDRFYERMKVIHG